MKSGHYEQEPFVVTGFIRSDRGVAADRPGNGMGSERLVVGMGDTAWARSVVIGLLILLVGHQAEGVITRLTRLKDVLAEARLVFTASVETIDPAKPAAVLVVDEDLMGKAAFRRLSVDLTGDSAAQAQKHPAQLLKRLAP